MPHPKTPEEICEEIRVMAMSLFTRVWTVWHDDTESCGDEFFTSVTDKLWQIREKAEDGMEQLRAAARSQQEEARDFSEIRSVASAPSTIPEKKKVAHAATNTCEKKKKVVHAATNTYARMVADKATETEKEASTAPTTPKKETVARMATNTGKTPVARARATTTPRLTGPTAVPSTSRRNSLPRTNAVVIHGVRTDRPLHETLRIISPQFDHTIVSGRWLVKAERRQGKAESSVVVVLGEAREWRGICWVGNRRLRMTEYEWDRGK